MAKCPAVHAVPKQVKLVEKLAIVAGLANFEQCLCRSPRLGAILAYQLRKSCLRWKFIGYRRFLTEKIVSTSCDALAALGGRIRRNLQIGDIREL